MKICKHIYQSKIILVVGSEINSIKYSFFCYKNSPRHEIEWNCSFDLLHQMKEAKILQFLGKYEWENS